MTKNIFHRFLLSLKWEQCLIVTCISIILILGISWGLPGQMRMKMLSGGRPLTEEQKYKLTSLREEYYKQIDIQEKKKIQDFLGTERYDLQPQEKEFCILSEDDRIAAFRSFIIGSSAIDERQPYSSLSRMDPGKFDLDPRIYFYGTTYLYPIGAFLMLLKLTDSLHVSSDISYYMDHPEDIARMYMVGRGLNIAAFIGTLLLLGCLGINLGGRLCAAFAMLTWACSTIVLNQSLVSKPHVYAAFWATLSISLLIKHLKNKSRTMLVLSAVAAGWAIGASIPCICIIIFFPLMLFRYYNLRKFLMNLLCVGIIIILVFFITNPYAIICYKKFLLSLKSIGSSQGWGYAVVSPGKIWPYLLGVFKQSYAFPISLFAVAGMLISRQKCDINYRYLAAGTALMLFFIGLSLANPRISIFIGPFLCLFAGYGLSEISSKIQKISMPFMIFIIVSLFLLPTFFTAQFAYDTIQDKKWYTSLENWINSLSSNHQPTFGVFGTEALSPINLPPFPFLNAQIVNLNCEESEIHFPEYVILGNYLDDFNRWKTHPIRHAYHLAFNLGYKQRYNNHLSLRTINQSRISGLIYKRKDNLAF